MSESGDNPYGGPSDPGSGQPSNPYGAPPPNPYGTQPPANPYGTQPPQPGGPYGGPYGAPGGQPPMDGVSVSSLIVSLLGYCTGIGWLVGLILGIVGITRTKNGQRRGRGLAIAGVVLGAVGLVLGIITIVIIVIVGVNTIVTPSNAKVGQCIDVDNNDGNSVSMIKESCSDSHDGEIVGVGDLTSANLSGASDGTICNAIVDAQTRELLKAVPEPLDYAWASKHPEDPKVGDRVVCYVTSSTKLHRDLLK